MKICVTGGAGFIGSHIVDAYIAQGHDVVVVDDLSYGNQNNVHPSARFENLSVTTDTFDELCDAENFDVINHHAAHMELRASIRKPIFDANINMLGSIRVLEAARRTNVQHCIIASSSAVIGAHDNNKLTEQTPCAPISPYGVSKFAMEVYADYCRNVHGMSITTLRYTNVYGARQNAFGESGVIAIFLEKFLRSQVPVVFGDGTQSRDYIAVSDVASANVLATTNRTDGTYFVCCSVGTTVNHVIELLRKGLGHQYAVEYGQAKLGDPQVVLASYEKFSTETGWKPTKKLDVGIQETIDWYMVQTR